MKRYLTLALSLLVVLSLLTVCASAEAFNPAGGCKTKISIKKANAADVVKDGVIGDGEYVEIELDRDDLTTDCMLSYESSDAFNSACEFLKNVHFYMSWDETHGLNVAVRSTLLETPSNKSPQPDDTYFDGFPGDEFLFQFGMMFRVSGSDGNTVMCRGISINTDSGTPLYGHYNEHGYTGALTHTWGEDYFIKVDGNTVTYEISFPIESVVPATSLNGKTPLTGTQLNFDVTATGGSLGELHKDSDMYAVSVGDAGYMSQWKTIDDPSHALGTFSDEAIPKSASDTTADTTSQASTTPAPTQDATTRIESSVVTETVYVTNDDGEVVTNESGESVTEIVSEIVTSVVTDSDSPTTAPVTGDPAIFASVLAVLTACGAVVAKKRK